MDPYVLSALLVVVVLGAISLWVLEDARSREQLDRPVIARFGDLEIHRPETWAVLCLLMIVLFLPLYLVARRAE